MFVALSICFWTMAVFGQSVTWQILPWPSNQVWGGSEGSPAVTNGNQIILTGQDVLSVQSFSGAQTFSFGVLLPNETVPNGAFEVHFVPTGEPTNLVPNPDVELDMTFPAIGQGGLQAQHNGGGGNFIWGPNPFTLATQTEYLVTISVTESGVVSWVINGQAIALSNSVVVPYSSYQIRLSSWQPTQVWQVNDFTTAVPSACPNITGTWTGQVNVADSWSGYHETTLSLQVTDQSTNGCLLRGYLNTGSAYSRGPWGCFSPGGLWGKVPFTGAILDTTGVVINFGIFGQASATLDMSQTPPVMNKFILLSSGGTANGDTAVGDLTEQPSAP
jgi:hypothetical protein